MCYPKTLYFLFDDNWKGESSIVALCNVWTTMHDDDKRGMMLIGSHEKQDNGGSYS